MTFITSGINQIILGKASLEFKYRKLLIPYLPVLILCFSNDTAQMMCSQALCAFCL